MKTYIVETKEIVCRVYSVRANNENDARGIIDDGIVLNGRNKINGDTIDEICEDYKIMSVKERSRQ
jgi:hypothetical protein